MIYISKIFSKAFVNKIFQKFRFYSHGAYVELATGVVLLIIVVLDKVVIFY